MLWNTYVTKNLYGHLKSKNLINIEIKFFFKTFLFLTWVLNKKKLIVKL